MRSTAVSTENAPAGWESEDRESARLVNNLKAGIEGAFEELYKRYFDRIYSYLRIAIKDQSEAEDAAQQVFMKAFETIPTDAFELRDRPLRAWLFIVARNCANDHWRRRGRVQPVEPDALDRRQDELEATDVAAELRANELRALRWLSDKDLIILIERLPEAQQQVLFLRYAVGIETAQIGQILERTPESVRQLQHRALRFLEGRLASVGREPVATNGARRQTMRRRGWRPPRAAHAFSLAR